MLRTLPEGPCGQREEPGDVAAQPEIRAGKHDLLAAGGEPLRGGPWGEGLVRCRLARAETLPFSCP